MDGQRDFRGLPEILRNDVRKVTNIKYQVLRDNSSGAEKLRVYPALFELEQEGWLTVTEREELGSAKRVRFRY